MKQASSNKNREKNVMEGVVSPSKMGLASRLEWIVRLVQHDIPDPEGPQALHALVQHMGAYLRGIRIRCTGAGHGGPHLSVLGEPTIPDELPMQGEDNHKPLDEKLALIRTVLGRELKAFLHPASPPMSVTAEVTERYSLKNEAGRRDLHRDWITDDVREGLRFRLLEDLAQAPGLLRECAAAGCGKLLVRHYRQEFCSPACRNRTNVRKYYERTKADKGGVTGKLSGAADSTTRKKQGRTKTKPRRVSTK
jgi:hypothetical protein